MSTKQALSTLPPLHNNIVTETMASNKQTRKMFQSQHLITTDTKNKDATMDMMNKEVKATINVAPTQF